MRPRIHNTLSYAVAALVFAVLAPYSVPGVPLVAGLWFVHFGRRAAESLWIHRYSGRLVLASDFIMEYVYYWGFAAWIAWSLRGAAWSPPGTIAALAGTSIFLVGECGNALMHFKLRAMRLRAGDPQRSVPRGGPFELVSCPHYLFEIISWCGFAIVAPVWASVAFLVLATIILCSYAYVRHRRYHEDFDGRDGRPPYPPRRKAIIPLVF